MNRFRLGYGVLAAVVFCGTVAGGLRAEASTTGSSGAPSASSGLIVFEGFPNGACAPRPCSSTTPNFDLWAVSADGTGLINITRTPGVDEQARWSPDGKRILFGSNRDGDFDVFVTDPAGAATEKVVDGAGNQTYGDWSPDGTGIAYVNDAKGTQDIFVAGRLGAAGKKIASFKKGVHWLDWSPNGRWLAFSKGSSSAMFNIFLVRPDGSGLRRLLDRDFYAEAPKWSPDGRRLTFVGGLCADGDCADAGWDIFTARPDGTNVRRVVGVKGSTWWVDSPSWSPDGKHIVYLKRTDPDDPMWGDLWVINTDGTGDRRILVKPDTDDFYPAWQPLP